jgi:hypothetical protein
VSALPAAASDFAAPRFLTSFTVRRGPFSNTLVAAPTISRATVRNVTTDNGGTPFGVAAVDLGLFVEPGVLTWRAGQDLARLTPQGDFVVRVLK